MSTAYQQELIFSDEELITATQLAYYNFSDRYLELYQRLARKPPASKAEDELRPPLDKA